MALEPVRRHPWEIPLLVVGTVVLVALIPVLAVVILEVFGVWWMVVFLALFISLYVSRGFLNAFERARSVL